MTGHGLSLVAAHGVYTVAVAPGLQLGLMDFATWTLLPHGKWDLSSRTRYQTCVPCDARQILDHWTTREVPINSFLNYLFIALHTNPVAPGTITIKKNEIWFMVIRSKCLIGILAIFLLKYKKIYNKLYQNKTQHQLREH